MGIDPLLGTVVGERYRIESLLGQGGMGAVYKAEHLLIRRKVALKCLRPELSLDASIVERFRREALAATAIGSPHIIEVTDMGRFDDGSLFMVMELLEGRALSAEIELGRLGVARAVHIAVQLCETLALAHEQGIVHRDLKPDNVFLITRDGVPDYVKVLDFGIAKFSGGPLVEKSGMTQAGSLLGTPRFMAPEQMLGGEIDARADLFAIGGVLYNALSGQAPFDGPTLGALLNNVCNAPRPSLRAVRADVPPELDAIVQRALAKAASERFASCLELARALSAFRNPAALVHDVAHGDTVAAAAPLHVAAPSPATPAPAAFAAQVPELAAGSERASPAHPGNSSLAPDSPKALGARRSLGVAVGAGAMLLVVAAALAATFRKPEPTARAEPPDQPVAPRPLVNAWVRIEAPAAGSALVLGVPDSAPSDTAGFRRRRGVTAPQVSYEIQQHEVTWREYEAWLAPLGRSATPPPGVPVSPEARRRLPAVNVSWSDARAFCQALGGDLPSEAEWEYAARGPQLLPNPWGDGGLPRPDVNAWRGAGAALSEVMSNAGDRRPVAPTTAVFDLIGNAREWTLDAWRADNQGEDDSWARAAGRSYRAVRGLPLVAPSDMAPPQIGAAYRDPLCAEGACPPDVATYLPGVGFRCARSAK